MIWSPLTVVRIASVRAFASTLAQDRAIFDPVQRAAIAVSTRLAMRPTLEGLESLREPLEVELAIAKGKLKTVRDNEVAAAYDEVLRTLARLSASWRLERGLADTAAKLARLQGDPVRNPETTATAAMQQNIREALKVLEETNSFYLTGVRPSTASTEVPLMPPPLVPFSTIVGGARSESEGEGVARASARSSVRSHWCCYRESI